MAPVKVMRMFDYVVCFTNWRIFGLLCATRQMKCVRLISSSAVTDAAFLTRGLATTRTTVATPATRPSTSVKVTIEQFFIAIVSVDNKKRKDSTFEQIET